MSKVEEVITHLMIMQTWALYAAEHNINFFTDAHMRDIVRWSDDACKILKAQSNYDELIKKYDDLSGWAEGHITFCKDCKYLEKNGIRKGVHYCVKTGLTVSDGWFCADGRRKLNDDRC